MGYFDGARILEGTSAATMQTRQFTNHPAVGGPTLGSQEVHIGGRRILAQPGDMLHFTAVLLVPELDLGLFVAINHGHAAQAPTELLPAFLGWRSPVPPWPLAASVPASGRDVSRFAGGYRSTRRNETGLEKLQQLFSPVEVRAVGMDTLEVRGLSVVPLARWVETTPGVFCELGGPEVIAFREDANGQVTHRFEGNFPAAGYTRLAWYERPAIHIALLLICVPFFVLSPVAWWLSRRRQTAPVPARASRAQLVAAAMCAVNLLFLAGLVVVIAQGRELLFGVTPLARGVRLLPLLSVWLNTLALGFAILSIKRGHWGIAGRMHYLLLVGLGLTCLGGLAYWTLIETGC